MSGILFVHNNFPGQFGFLAEALLARGETLASIGSMTAQGVEGVRLNRWHTFRRNAPGILPEAMRAELDLIRASAALGAATTLRDDGFSPDLIIGHPGWGETLFLKEVWPEAKMILHAELFYRSKGGDANFDPEFGMNDLESDCRIAAMNATLAWAYAEADRLVAPTPFQAATLPASLRSRATIIHEGVDVEAVRPMPDAEVDVDGRIFRRDRPLVTFVNRVLEPMRGCHTFFRALPKILDSVGDAEIVIVGSEEGRGYGEQPPDGTTWKEHFWKEIEGRVDPSRIHFTGRLTNDALHALMSMASAHVYLTYPFVLSWSLIEAMACEAMVIASDTAPVRDVLRHGDNAVLVDFFRPDLLADAVIDAIANPGKYAGMRKAARATVLSDYDRNRICLPQWLDLIDGLRAG